ncbi:MAG: C69 family dipeptidase [Eubacteriales bacterium]|nr:C69 family dipeptidase [Eubacteriales bacterium]
MKKFKSMAVLVAVVIVFALSGQLVFACTPLGAGKEATVDGSVLVSHTCDGWYDQRIIIIPGGQHEEGEMVDIYNDPCLATRPNREPVKVGEIPQAAETYTYFHVGYPFMNEKQLMMGEFTWGGRDEVYNSEGMFVIANLEELGLARTATAREAIKVMGELVEQYGYKDGGETLVIGDKNELWVFEVCGPGLLWTPESGQPGAHWAAARIPDDEVFVGANRARIGVIDFEDTENFMWSTNLTELPLSMGWWEEGEDFNFAEIFNPEPYGAPFYQSRREWRAFSLLAPSQEFPILDEFEAYPLSIKPDEKVSVQTIMDIYSDHYEGTPYDLTTDKAAGPFGSPTRWQIPGALKPEYAKGQDWERSIALFRCSYSFVSQSRDFMPDPVGGVLWFGQDSPDTTVYVPLYCGTTEVPEEWSSGLRHVFDPNSAWWAFNLVNNWANLRWDAMYEEIRARKAEIEAGFFDKQQEIEEEAIKLYEEDPEKAVEFITKYSYDSMNDVNEKWWDFAYELIGKYYDGLMMNEDGSSTALGYPTEYLEEVEFGQTALDDLANKDN